VAHHVRPAAKVIGVQSEAAPAAYRTWKEGRAVQQPSRTMAEGLATGVPFALPQMIMARYLDDFVLVSDQDIMRAMIHMIERAHTLAEAAGAAPLAAAYQGRDQLRGLSVGLVCSGGNSSLEHLRMALNQMDEANQARA
jgi:threonine dehydratase